MQHFFARDLFEVPMVYIHVCVSLLQMQTFAPECRIIYICIGYFI
jgi:hypothetical protein